ncbi:MAG TPA: hypothetical protein VN203_12745, partial [Candidatus Acidoferrum sp.]|nr:hypothetical protein [Candidatus Acidoferrum sp.]
MNTRITKLTLFMAVLALGLTPAQKSFAGEAKKWEDVPEAVRATILANGGKVGPVDLENGKIDGKAVYEAVGKDKDGKEADLVVTEDGKLAKMKYDGPADKAQEDAAKTKNGKKVSGSLKFSHPQDITNPWLPLASLKQDILEGREDNKST